MLTTLSFSTLSRLVTDDSISDHSPLLEEIKVDDSLRHTAVVGLILKLIIFSKLPKMTAAIVNSWVDKVRESRNGGFASLSAATGTVSACRNRRPHTERRPPTILSWPTTP